MHLEELTTQEFVRYTFQVVKRKYEGQTARILGQQRRRPGDTDMLIRMRIRRKREVEGLNEGFTSQGGSKRTG